MGLNAEFNPVAGLQLRLEDCYFSFNLESTDDKNTQRWSKNQSESHYRTPVPMVGSVICQKPEELVTVRIPPRCSESAAELTQE